MYTTSMEVGLMKRQICGNSPNTNTKSSSERVLGIRKESEMMFKPKPKIRIIHIFAPEIIKTDVANFRELVQRLTGKPDPNTSSTKSKRIRRNISRSSTTTSSSEDDQLRRAEYNSSNKSVAAAPPPKKQLDIRTGFRPNIEMMRERIKGEEEIWGGANSGGGFLGGFADLEYGFMQELTAAFPLLPFDATTTTTHMDNYGSSESQLA